MKNLIYGMVKKMTDKELKRAKDLFPDLKLETTRNLEIMLLDIRKKDWSTISNLMIRKHDYIQTLLLIRGNNK